VKKGAQRDKAKAEIGQLLRQLRRLPEGAKNNFTIFEFKEIVEKLKKSTGTLTVMLGAVAAISLLIGGIGIMNIMLASVTERTREIGIRLAIGALEKEVMTQFLIEATTISVLGGCLGILLSFFATLGLSRIMQIPSVFSTGMILIAFLVSAAIGLIFGFIPALKTARIDPIRAIRRL
jgi:putative ABC transport system permease protein